MPFMRRAVPGPDGNVPVSTLWHFSQATGTCLPVSGNRVAPCAKFVTANFAVVTVWQVSHDARNCPRCGSAWHDAHAVAVATKPTRSAALAVVRAGAMVFT